MNPSTTLSIPEQLTTLLSQFKLPTVAEQLVRRLSEAGLEEALEVVLEVFELEASERWERRVERLRRASKLPIGKTFDTLELTRLPLLLQQKLRQLTSGNFLEGSTNILAFGLPGTGKTHALCAVGHALVEAGHPVLFTPTYKLVQRLLAAKRNLTLPQELRKLDKYVAIILDDIGYIKQDEDEIEVLFTLMAERYERRSLMITSNLVFSQWEQIFKNPMTTAAAIDRLVHHSVILEFDVSSYRTLSKQSENAGEQTETKTSITDESEQSQ
jgi:DNA replication protein DnaC